MTAADRLITADELAVLPDDGMLRELVSGELRMMSPAGGRHGKIVARITWLLTGYVQQHALGEVYTPATCSMPAMS